MSQTIGLLRCQLGDEAYAFEMSSVASVRHASALRHADVSATDHLVGWVALPGEDDAPVYRLADCLSRVSSAPESHQHVVVVNTSLGSQGFLVDSVSRVLPVPVEHFRECPELLNDPTRRLFQSVVLFRQSGEADSMSLLLSPERLHRDAVPLTATFSGERGGVSPAVTSLAAEPSMNRGADAAPLAKSHHAIADRIVLFPLANTRVDGHELLCGLSVAQVVEILEPLPIIPVPLAPSHVAGFVMWREQALPVLQLSRSLGVSDAATATRMMIVRQGREFLVLLTSQSMKARRLPLPHQPCPTPTGLDSAAILGTFQTDSEVLVVPNLSRLARPQSLGA